MPEGQNRRLSLTSGNAGELLRRLDFYSNMKSGALELSGKSDDSQESQPFFGNLEISNYNIVNAPTLARMLTFVSLTGILDKMKGEEGIAFEAFNMAALWNLPILYVCENNTQGALTSAEGGISSSTMATDDLV